MIMAIRFNKEEKKTLERAQKDAEMVSESAKDARNRKEAKTISNKLESEIKDKEGEVRIAQQQEQAIENILDETKNNIRLTARTATKEVPQYTRKIGDIQEETIKTTREIADNYIESQKEIISIYRSIWTPFLENANSRFWNYWSISPREYAETYGTIVSNFADNLISVTRLTNNAISVNTGFFSVVLQQSKYNSEEFSRLGVNAAKVFNETSKEIVSSSLFQLESAESRQSH
jgi:hypothetical protein